MERAVQVSAVLIKPQELGYILYADNLICFYENPTQEG
jgi:hypothetical protein